MRWGQKLVPVVMILPSVIFLFALGMYPFLYGVYISFTDASFYSPVTTFIGIDNYLLLFGSSRFWYDFGVTVLFAGASVTLEFLIGFGIALLLNRELRGITFFRSIMLLPLTVPPIVVALIWKAMYNPGYGLINYFLRPLGFPILGWVSDPGLALPSVIIVDLWQWTFFVTLILLAGLQALPKEPFEAAQLDGASKLQSFGHITLPLMKRIIALALVLRIMDALRVFDLVWGLTSGGPGYSTEVLHLSIYLEVFRFKNIGLGSAIAVLFTYFILFLCLMLFRTIRTEEK